MGVALSLGEDGYGRGLTKGGGKRGWPAFFLFKAVTAEKKHSGSLGWVCCSEPLSSCWSSDTLSICSLCPVCTRGRLMSLR